MSAVCSTPHPEAPMPPTPDPFSDADNTDSADWILWPIKCWPLWVRIPLLIVLGLFLWWLSAYAVPMNKSNAAPAEMPTIQDVRPESANFSPPPPLANPGPNTEEGAVDDFDEGVLTVTPAMLLKAEVIGVIKHEDTCASLECQNAGCAMMDGDDKLVIILMNGEYVALLSDGRLIRSHGEIDDPGAAVLRCDYPP